MSWARLGGPSGIMVRSRQRCDLITHFQSHQPLKCGANQLSLFQCPDFPKHLCLFLLLTAFPDVLVTIPEKNNLGKIILAGSKAETSWRNGMEEDATQPMAAAKQKRERKGPGTRYSFQGTLPRTHSFN